MSQLLSLNPIFWYHLLSGETLPRFCQSMSRMPSNNTEKYGYICHMIKQSVKKCAAVLAVSDAILLVSICLICSKETKTSKARLILCQTCHKNTSLDYRPKQLIYEPNPPYTFEYGLQFSPQLQCGNLSRLSCRC